MGMPLKVTQQELLRLVERIPVWQPFWAGDAVRITRDSLVDVTGTVLRTTTNERCIITIDGVGTGVLVIVSAASLERVDRSASHCTAASGLATNGD